MIQATYKLPKFVMKSKNKSCEPAQKTYFPCFKTFSFLSHNSYPK